MLSFPKARRNFPVVRVALGLAMLAVVAVVGALFANAALDGGDDGEGPVVAGPSVDTPTVIPPQVPPLDQAAPVLAEEVFADIFQNATRVDRLSIDDIKNCEVVSSLDVNLGDRVSVEVALARREDSMSHELNFRPYFTVIRDSSGDGILGNIAEDSHLRFGLERTINNPWNETNTGPFVVAVYRGKRSAVPETGREDVVIGDWVPN